MSDRAAHLKPDDFSLGQVTEFIKKFSQEGGTPEQLQKLIENRANMLMAIRAAQGLNNPYSYDLARLILGDDFISPEEVSDILGESYNENQLYNLRHTLPDPKRLQRLYNDGYVLSAYPPKNLSLIDLEKFVSRPFEGNSFKKEKDRFSSEVVYSCAENATRKSGDCWLAVKKNFGSNDCLRPYYEYRPCVATVSYIVIAYYKLRKSALFEGSSVETSSEFSFGSEVAMNSQTEGGFTLSVEFFPNKAPENRIARAVSLERL